MKKIFVFSIISLIVIPLFAHAWGIAFVNDHFTLKQGQTQDVKFSMQNYVGDESKRMLIELSGDKEIATILDKKDYYLLLPKTKDYPIVIRIAIPEQAQKSYEVKANFIAYAGGSGISLSTAKVVPIYIEVPDGTLTEQPEETSLDLTKTYQKAEEKIEEEEGQTQTSAPKVQSLAVLEEKTTFDLLPFVLIIIAVLIVLISTTIYIQKKRRKKLELI